MHVVTVSASALPFINLLLRLRTAFDAGSAEDATACANEGWPQERGSWLVVRKRPRGRRPTPIDPDAMTEWAQQAYADVVQKQAERGAATSHGLIKGACARVAEKHGVSERSVRDAFSAYRRARAREPSN
jgi:hypothetical protein